MMMVPRSTAEAVRPRVEGEREAEILDAAVEILIEHGYDRLTMDAVAVRAKASKATLYRRWTSKQSLVVDAVIRSKKAADPQDHDTGSLRGDLIATFCGHGGLTERDSTLLLAAVITALHTDDDFAHEFRERFLKPKIELNQKIYERAMARGEIKPDVDLSVLGPALPGILLHRSFVLGEAITRETVERVVDAIIMPCATGCKPR
jgi:AcrR family transcriptional regulator